MISLKNILLEIEDSVNGNILEFPNDNFTLSIFPGEKKLLFSSQDHNSITNKIRTLITMLKENFKVLRVNDTGSNTLEVEIDPRQDFDAVVDFIRNEV